MLQMDETTPHAKSARLLGPYAVSLKELVAQTLLAAALCYAAPSWAGRPLATEDAGIMEHDECEVENFYATQAHPNVTALFTQAGCGVGRNTELALGISREVSPDSTTNYLILGGKTALVKMADENAGIAIAYTFTSGKESKLERHTSTEIKAVATLSDQYWLLHTNIGWLHDSASHNDLVIWGISAERLGFINGLDLMAEVFGDNRTSPWIQVGVRWEIIPKRMFLDTSHGVQTNGFHSRLTTVGVNISI
jgi:hypothetical protein